MVKSAVYVVISAAGEMQTSRRKLTVIVLVSQRRQQVVAAAAAAAFRIPVIFFSHTKTQHNQAQQIQIAKVRERH